MGNPQSDIRNEDYDLSVFFNLYCVTKKTANDASEMESILREELAGKFPVNVHIDPSSVEVKGKIYKLFLHGSFGFYNCTR